MWDRQGRELFFLDGDDYLTAVAIRTDTGSFSPGTARRILQTRYYAGFTSRGYDLRAFDIAPDGGRFLMIKKSEAEDRSAATPLAMTVVLNWFDELETRLPAGR
jgi:hypothetical protein